MLFVKFIGPLTIFKRLIADTKLLVDLIKVILYPVAVFKIFGMGRGAFWIGKYTLCLVNLGNSVL
jgi:uncharacterized membrane protein YqaE (UPF0057 family)